MSQMRVVQGTGQKRMKRLAEKHMCIAHGHRQQCGIGQREGGGDRAGKTGDMCNSVNDKSIVKKIYLHVYFTLAKLFPRYFLFSLAIVGG